MAAENEFDLSGWVIMATQHPNSGLVYLMRQLLHRLRHLKAQLDELGEPCIHEISWRPKSVGSVKDKIQRNRLHISNPKDLFTQIDDLVGIRVVCYNLRDVYKVARFLRELPMAGIKLTSLPHADGYSAIHDEDTPNLNLVYELVKQENKISKPTLAGYRAYHLYLGARMRIKVPFDEEIYDGNAILEVQVRTMAQDLWSILSHRDFYKTDVNIPKSLREHMRVMSDRLHSVDRTAQILANEIRQSLSVDLGKRVTKRAVSATMRRHFNVKLSELELGTMIAALKIGHINTTEELLHLLRDPACDKRAQGALHLFGSRLFDEAGIQPLVFGCVLSCLKRREKPQRSSEDISICSSVLSPAGQAWPAYVRLLSVFFREFLRNNGSSR